MERNVANLLPNLVLILGLVLSTNVWAEWMGIVDQLDGTTYYADKDSIKKNGDIITYTEKVVLPTDRSELGKSLKHIHHWVTYKKIDCKNRLQKVSHYNFYTDVTGEVHFMQTKEPEEKGWQPVLEDGANEGMLNGVCLWVSFQ